SRRRVRAAAGPRSALVRRAQRRRTERSTTVTRVPDLRRAPAAGRVVRTTRRRPRVRRDAGRITLPRRQWARVMSRRAWVSVRPRRRGTTHRAGPRAIEPRTCDPGPLEAAAGAGPGPAEGAGPAPCSAGGAAHGGPVKLGNAGSGAPP